MAVKDAWASVSNCVLINNTAARGGALVNAGGRPARLVNCTVTGNAAFEACGGILSKLYSGSVPNPWLANCILWGNSDPNGTGETAQILDGPPIVNFCCVQGWTGDLGGIGNLGDDPIFVDPSGPDGDPNTFEDNDYHLGLRSPCIDAGDNSAVPADVGDLDGDGDTEEPVPFDLDGHPRFVDDPATPDGGTGVMPRVDMGAYEFQVTRVSLDIRPGACPNWLTLDDPAVLPMAVVGTADFDVTQIDPNSLVLRRADGVGGNATPLVGPSGPKVRVEDVATPFEGELCECHDLKGDGVDDLSMEFATRDVVSQLRLNELPGGTWVVWVELVVSGELLDGTRFGGADCISIVPAVPGSAPPDPASASEPSAPGPDGGGGGPDGPRTGQPTSPDAAFSAGDSTQQNANADRRAHPPASESRDANADEDDDAPDASVTPIVGCGPVSPAFLLVTIVSVGLLRRS